MPMLACSPLMLRLPSQVPRSRWFAVSMLICSFLKLGGTYPWWVWCSLFWQDPKLCWKPCFYRAVSQSYLRTCLPGCCPLFGSNKTLCYSYYRLFVDYFHRQLPPQPCGFQGNPELWSWGESGQFGQPRQVLGPGWKIWAAGASWRPLEGHLHSCKNHSKLERAHARRRASQASSQDPHNPGGQVWRRLLCRGVQAWNVAGPASTLSSS